MIVSIYRDHKVNRLPQFKKLLYQWTALHNAFQLWFFFFLLILPIKTVPRTNKIFKIKQLQDRKGAIKPIHNEMRLWNEQTVKDWRPVFEGMEAMLSNRLVSIAVSEVTNTAKIEQVNPPALGTQKSSSFS